MIPYNPARSIRLLRCALVRIRTTDQSTAAKGYAWADVAKSVIVGFPYREGPEYDARALNYAQSLFCADGYFK